MESTRTFGERLKQHLRAPSPMYNHGNISGHHISVKYFSIVGREAHNITRTIKGAMDIRVNDQSLNRNIGIFQLPHTWAELLLNTPFLHLQ